MSENPYEAPQEPRAPLTPGEEQNRYALRMTIGLLAASCGAAVVVGFPALLAGWTPESVQLMAGASAVVAALVVVRIGRRPPA